MKRVFVDTKILIDVLADRQPFSKFSVRLLQLAEENKIRLFVSSHSIATTHYLLKKYLNEKSLRGVLLRLLDFIEVIPIDQDILKRGLRSAYSDFEDGLQILCATSVKRIDFIVTRNLKDFKGAPVRILAPEEAVRELELC